MTKAAGWGGSFRLLFLLGSLAALSGCSLSNEDKQAREEALKQQAGAFVNLCVQKDWAGLFHLTDGSFDGVDKLQAYMTQPWDPTATLTGGNIASMAWVNDDTTKLKINWIFQEGSVLSYSSETFAWGWQDGNWKLKGRVLR